MAEARSQSLPEENAPSLNRPSKESSGSSAAANYRSSSCHSTVPSNVYRLKPPIKPTDGQLFEDVPWICSFCQEGAGEEMGPLYGPFYLDTWRSDDRWPPYADASMGPDGTVGSTNVGRTGINRGRKFLHVEIWFHAHCLLWTHGISLRDGEVVGLGRQLPKYWKKECTFCKKPGAAIQCVSGPCNVHYHYPCAIRSGLQMNENSWGIHCPDHP